MRCRSFGGVSIGRPVHESNGKGIDRQALQPVLRFSTRDVKSLRNQSAPIIFGITATSGAKPFVLLGLVRRPDGSYSEAVFMPSGKELGWGGFVHTPGNTTEVSFYALDDSAAVRSPCRK
jgi:hypothetical protein